MEESKENREFLKIERINPLFPSVTERYFKPKIVSEDQLCILTHSNRLCILTLAPCHPILINQSEVTSVNFDISGHKNRLNNKVSGKFKKGGQKLKEKSLICSVNTSDGQFTIKSCVCGSLVEINENLIAKPNLLKLKPWSEGYIAIILPPFPKKQ